MGGAWGQEWEWNVSCPLGRPGPDHCFNFPLGGPHTIFLVFYLATIEISKVEILERIPATNTNISVKDPLLENWLKKSHFTRNGSIIHVRENGTEDRVGHSSFPIFHNSRAIPNTCGR